MYKFCECKYSFKPTFLWQKLDFHTRVHKKDVFSGVEITAGCQQKLTENIG